MKIPLSIKGIIKILAGPPPPKKERKIQTVDIFASEPWLIAVAEKAARELYVPWECSPDIIEKAKEAALSGVRQGSTMRDFSKTLSPSIFRTKNEAKHAMAKISACINEEISRKRAMSIGLQRFFWQYLDDSLCNFPEHKKHHGRSYPYINGADGDWPAKNYGCRCWASPVLR